MLIKKLSIRNFRCITDLDLDLEVLTAFLGSNGSGKSTIISGIEVFYDTSSNITKDDFYNGDTSLQIEIFITFSNLRDEERLEFAPYLNGDELSVTKRISLEGDKFVPRYYGSVQQIPRFVEIRNIANKVALRTAYNELAEIGEMDGLEAGATTGDDALERMAIYEQAHPDLTEPRPKEGQFFGPPNVGGGKLDHYTKFVRIPAVKEVIDEMEEKKGTSFSELLGLIVESRISQREDIREFQARYEEEIRRLYSKDNLRELPELGEQISELLNRYSPGSMLHLEWGDPEIPKLSLPKAVPSMTEHRFRGSIERKGHGSQRALLVTLLHFLAMVNKDEDEAPPGGEEQVDGQQRPVTSPDLILAIDEPELFLHPSRSKYLANLLDQLAGQSDGARPSKNQIVYTTHSPYFVNLERFNRIRRINKVTSEDFPAPYTTSRCFKISDAIAGLAVASGKNPNEFTEETFIAHSQPVMTTHVNEGFFADVIVLVEGPGDAGLLWGVQEMMGLGWEAKGISIIPVGGKNSLDKPIIIFNGLMIPVFTVFDGDSSKRETDQNEGNIRTNRKLLQLSNEEPEDYPGSSQRLFCTVFEDKIETELKKILTADEYNQIGSAVSRETGVSPNSLLKNFRCAVRFCNLAYELGKPFEIIEQTITRIDTIWNQNSTAQN